MLIVRDTLTEKKLIIIKRRSVYIFILINELKFFLFMEVS